MIKGLASGTVAACLLMAAPAAASVTCSHESSPPMGARGDYLEIKADEIEDQVAIVRRGRVLAVTDDRTGTRIACTGPDPTVFNIDRVLFIAAADGAGLFVSLAGGRFEPGATRSEPSPEIEIQARTFVRFPGNIGIGGLRGADSISVSSQRRSRRHLVNFDRRSDDADDLVFPASVVGLLVRGGRGDDTIAGSRLLYPLSLSVFAGPGRDRVIGGPGPDLLFGRAGADFLRGGAGRDELDCGPGNDVARSEMRDFVTRCETRRPERMLAFP